MLYKLCFIYISLLYCYGTFYAEKESEIEEVLYFGNKHGPGLLRSLHAMESFSKLTFLYEPSFIGFKLEIKIFTLKKS